MKTFHWDVQKRVSYTGSRKRFLLYYGLWFVMAGNVFSIVFHSLQHFSTKLKNIYTFPLSVCPSVCGLSNSRKYSSNVLKFIYAICNWYRTERIENAMYGAKDPSTEAQKCFPMHYDLLGGKNLSVL